MKALVFLLAVVFAGTLWAADAFTGTWKLSPAKSKFPKGFETKEMTVVMVEQGANIAVTAKGVGGDGKAENRVGYCPLDWLVRRCNTGSCQDQKRKRKKARHGNSPCQASRRKLTSGGHTTTAFRKTTALHQPSLPHSRELGMVFPSAFTGPTSSP